MPPNKKLGRPRLKTSTFYDSEGNEMKGFRYDSSADTYYFRWKDKKRIWQKRNCGRDENKARFKYYRLLSELEGEAFTTAQKPNYNLSFKGKGKIAFTDKINSLLENHQIDPAFFLNEVMESFVISEVDIQDSFVWERAKTLIQSDPKKAADILGIPYENLIGLRKKKIYTLKEIGDYYFNQDKFKNLKKRSQINELKEIRKSWCRFVETLGVETVIEVAKEHINNYYDNIYEEANEKDWSTSTIRKYFLHPKRVLNTAILDFDEPSDIIELKSKCSRKLKVPKKVIKNPPKLIKKQDFVKILEVSDPEEKAMWLLSMNGAYYAIDLGMLPISAIDFEEKTIVFRRSKMERRGLGHRSCFLWEKTIEAIIQYQKQKPHSGETLFYNSRDKKKYNRDWITAKFRSCLKRAKIEKVNGQNKYTHQNFRDSVKTIGHKTGYKIRNSVDAVMGQKPAGVGRDYIDPEEYPQIAEEACMAVHDYYFG